MDASERVQSWTAEGRAPQGISVAPQSWDLLFSGVVSLIVPMSTALGALYTGSAR